MRTLRGNILKNILVATLILVAGAGRVAAADLPTKAKPLAAVDPVPFFLVNDNRLTYAYQFTGTQPGTPGTTAKQVYAFTHFDVWAYGTNFINLLLEKSDHNAPAGPCPVIGTNCAGYSEFYGLIRSTFGFNQIFNTKAFTVGPLQNVSFEVGVDGQTANSFPAFATRKAVAGLQFAFNLPYNGYFNIAPLYYKQWDHNAYYTPAFAGPFPGVPDGSVEYRGSWAVEMNYDMNLGFLPENMQFFSISGRAGFYGPKGTGAPAGAVSPTLTTKTEINSEPIRLTFDASKAFVGPKYSHFVDVWVAYRYWKNKFGLDDSNPANAVCYTGGANNHSCTESSLYTGVSVKF